MQEVFVLVRDAFQQPAVRAAAVVVVSVIAAGLLHVLLGRVLPRLTARTRSDLDDRLLRAARRPVFVTLIAGGALLALDQFSLADPLMVLIRRLVLTLLLVIWLGACFRIGSLVLEMLSGLAGRQHWIEERTVPLFDNLGKIVIFGAAIYALLKVWHLDVTPWLASAGIAGIAIGFAAKDTLANLFGGLFIIIDAPYKIGDFVNLDTGERGQVVKIGLRSTRLLTRDDIEITLPNAQIANAKIVNESGGPWEKTRVAIQVGVAYGSDIDRVRETLLAAATSVDLVLDDPAPRIRFQEMGDSALTFRVLCWIEAPVLRGQAIDLLNSAIYKALGAAGIEIPFPQRVVHLRPPVSG